MKRSIIAALFVALLLSLPSNGVASIARAVSFNQKVEQADDIILGRCISQESSFDPSGRWILTYSTFEVTRSYKGTPAARITVVTPGGRVGTLHQETIGVPHFDEGEVNILFIRHDRIGPTVLFFDQGAYQVGKSAEGEILIAPVQSQLIVVDPQTGKAAAQTEGAKSLQEFETAVSSALRAPRRNAP